MKSFMTLSHEQIGRFQKVYEQYYGQPIEFELASQYATELVELMRNIYLPLPIKNRPQIGGDVYGST